MAKLILSFENTVLKTIPLDKERITIGRRPDNDIQIDNLAVSGLHAVITTIVNDSVIEDHQSTNGTIVNGQTVQKHMLQHNDVIELGKHKLRFLSDAPAYQDYAKTVVIRKPGTAEATVRAADVPTVLPPAAPAAPAAAPAAPAAAHAPVREATLQVLSGAAVGRVLELNKSLTTIGKAGVQVVAFTRRPVGYFVAQVEGEQPALFNGEPLGEHPRQLNDQDTVEIAGTKMRFVYK
ncbi:MAG: FHA domain-containing protein [Burkholderiaceae bacterium]|nr:FHA domain-containing protein [Burkholderiaceae bacterium]